jgi:hypothetical protein
MTLNELVAEVVNLTGRLDKEDYIRRQVRASIIQIHKTANYPRDRVEEITVLQVPTTLIKLTLPPRFRKFEALAAVQSNGAVISLTTNDNLYERKDPTDLLNNSFAQSTDHYYVAGAAVNIRSSVIVPNVYMLYWQQPEVADNDLQTWAMADNAELFLDLALAKTLGTFGNAKRAQEHQGSYISALDGFVADNLVEGY